MSTFFRALVVCLLCSAFLGVACSASQEIRNLSGSTSAAGGAGPGSGGASGSLAMGSGGTTGSITLASAGGSGPTDTDDDGIDDDDELPGDSDNDGIPNYKDPINDGDPPALKFTAISTTFNNPIGIDYHEPSNTVVMSVNYAGGTPWVLERIQFDGMHKQFSDLTGFTDEVKIATARSNNPQGFPSGDLFVGNGVDGQIVRITDDGKKVINPWVDLPGDNNGLMRGSLYVDRTGVWGGDLLAVTTVGQVWRVTKDAKATMVAAVGVHLEGTAVCPNKPARFGPLAGKFLVGAEEQSVMYAFGTDGKYDTYMLGVQVEDIDIVTSKENFFGVNFGTSRLLGAEAAQFEKMTGDVLLTQEVGGSPTGLFRLKWDGQKVVAQPIPIAAGSAMVGQWEHTTFAAAGIVEIPPPK
jgi:hypothetical protein